MWRQLSYIPTEGGSKILPCSAAAHFTSLWKGHWRRVDGAMNRQEGCRGVECQSDREQAEDEDEAKADDSLAESEAKVEA